MARKNPFASLMDDTQSPEGQVALDYTIKGASRSIISSIDELSQRADKLLQGETVVELDPATIDASFVRDRMEDDEQEFADLLNAIRERGQDSPILVRPHPSQSGRYMAVFGHRRIRVARELGRPVRAVVKDIKDRDHVVAQGQENTARANLSFIEKALFAGELARLSYDNDNTIVLAALSVEKATLSKMLAVASMPGDLLQIIGAAKGIGRDRWYELKMLLDKPANLTLAREFVDTDEFRSLSGDDRFNRLLATLKGGRKVTKAIAPRNSRQWMPADRAVKVDIKSDGRSYTLSLKAKDAVGFGEFISDNLAQLYADYQGRKD